jgi:hypothetical protein
MVLALNTDQRIAPTHTPHRNHRKDSTSDPEKFHASTPTERPTNQAQFV